MAVRQLGRRVDLAKAIACGLAIALTATLAKPAPAQEAERDSLSVTIENDRFSNTDRHYTTGTRLAYQWGHDPSREWVAGLARALPLLAPGGRLRPGVALGQNIYTPADTQLAVPPAGERPYAGWLYLGLSLSSETKTRLDSVTLELGTIGPSALGRQVQNGFHDLIGVEKSLGWDTQLKDEIGINLVLERRVRRYQAIAGDIGVDVIPHIGGSIGNVQTYLGGGATFRFGASLPDDFGPGRIRPASPGSDTFSADGFGWYLFAGAEARVVAHSIFLDGNTFRDSRSVDRIPMVGDLQFGAALLFERFRLSYTQVFRTREFEGQDGLDGFGSINVTVRF